MSHIATALMCGMYVPLILEEFVVEDEHNYRYRDVGVGEIEYRPEEIVVFVDEEREPLRDALPAEQREVEHVYDFAHEKRGVAIA